MALRDVKDYYYTTQAQYLTMKEDLADFEQALADGHITEDQLEAIKADVADVERNYYRLSYIMFLFNMPNRKQKKAGFKKVNAAMIEKFDSLGATVEAVSAENEDTLAHFRAELKKLKEEK